MPIKDFEEKYQKGELPWDTNRPDPLLVDFVREHNVSPCRVLELGSGTGTNAVWLAENGFTVTGIDISPTAVAMARDKAQGLKNAPRFEVADVLAGPITGGPYDLVIDRGCFHVFPLPQTRAVVAERIRAALAPQGLWFSIIGSTEGPEREEGPPRLSVLAIAGTVEPFFEILMIKAATIDSKLPDDPRAWACVFRRR